MWGGGSGGVSVGWGEWRSECWEGREVRVTKRGK